MMPPAMVAEAKLRLFSYTIFWSYIYNAMLQF